MNATPEADENAPNGNATPTAAGAKQKTPKEVQQEIQAIIRQITASVTFLPLLEEACTFDLSHTDTAQTFCLFGLFRRPQTRTARSLCSSLLSRRDANPTPPRATRLIYTRKSAALGVDRNRAAKR